MDHVVLLHGMLITGRWMRKLERALTRAGYKVHNLTYPSDKHPLGEQLYHLHERIAPLIKDAPKAHFVGFSMGGVLVRAYAHVYRPANLGRIVQWGAPNHGSEIADALLKYRWFRWMFGPASKDLTTDQSHIAQYFGPVDYELGIIAGTRTIDPIFSRYLPRPHDGKVSVESTKVEGMKEHKLLPVAHTLMPFTQSVIDETLHFIKHGRFR